MTTPEQKRAAMLSIKQFFARHAIEGMIRSLPSDALFLEPLVDDLAKILKNQDSDYVAPVAECRSLTGEFDRHYWIWVNSLQKYRCRECGLQKNLDTNGIRVGDSLTIADHYGSAPK